MERTLQFLQDISSLLVMIFVCIYYKSGNEKYLYISCLMFVIAIVCLTVKYFRFYKKK